jgi:hypothetical protein
MHACIMHACLQFWHSLHPTAGARDSFAFWVLLPSPKQFSAALAKAVQCCSGWSTLLHMHTRTHAGLGAGYQVATVYVDTEMLQYATTMTL